MTHHSYTSLQIAAILAAGILTPAVNGQDAADDTVAENSARITELEDMVFDLDRRTGSRASWQAFSAESVSLGGALSVIGTRVHGESSNSTAVNGAFFEMYVKAEISDDYSVFATPGFFWITPPTFADGANPDTAPTVDQSDATFQRAYGEWHPSDGVNVKLGRFGTQHGVIASEYFVPTRIVSMAPLMARLIGGNTLYPQKLDGIQFSGSRAINSSTLQYMAYMGVDTVETDAFSSGLRAGWIVGESGLSLATNFGHGKRTSFSSLNPMVPVVFNAPAFWSPFPTISNSNEEYDFYGVDIDFRKGPWVVKSEFYTSDEQGGQSDRQGFYFQPAFYLTPEWSIAARADDFRAGQGLGHASETVLSLNYNPNANVRYRLDYHLTNLPEAATADELEMLVFSASFSF